MADNELLKKVKNGSPTWSLDIRFASGTEMSFTELERKVM
jgi:hypothetical protein